MRPLSHSSIHMYLECPQKWHFKYVDRLPEKPRHFFSFGQSVHSALEYFYGQQTLTPPGLAEVLAFFEKNWKAQGYKDAAQEAAYKAEGRQILGDFHRIHVPVYKPPFFVEYSFNLKVDGVAVTGKVDRIDKLENGKLAIVDYKTGKAFDLDRVKQDAQLTMYQMACEERLGLQVESLTFYHLPSQTPLTTAPHEPALVEKLRKTIVKVADSIQKGAHEPKPEEYKCRWCDFKPHCPVFRHQYVAHEPPAAEGAALAPEKTDDDRLAELVDRFGRMKEEVHELEATLEDVREEIVELLKKKGYLRAFGADYEAGLTSEERWEFADKAAVLEALKRHGLYDRVLKPSAPEVQKLMKDGALPDEARRELEALGKKVEAATLRCHRVSEG